MPLNSPKGIFLYRVFIPRMGELTGPLFAKLKKNQPWTWTEEDEEFFEKLKNSLSEETLLEHLDFNEPFFISCDASGRATGACLFQYRSGTPRAIAFHSKVLSGTQRSYGITKKEGLALTEAVKAFRIYVKGQEVIALTYLKPLLALRNVQADLTPTMARMAMVLDEFNLDNHYREGRNQNDSDFLSRANTTTEISLREAQVEEFGDILNSLARGKREDYKMKDDLLRKKVKNKWKILVQSYPSTRVSS